MEQAAVIFGLLLNRQLIGMGIQASPFCMAGGMPLPVSGPMSAWPWWLPALSSTATAQRSAQIPVQAMPG